MILLILFHAIYASLFTLGKAGLSYAQPVVFVALRMILSGGLAWLYYLFFQRKVKINPRHFHLFLLVAIFQMYSLVPEYWALEYMSSSTWSLIYTLTPFFTALFSYLYFKEKITWMKILGLLIGFIAIMPSIAPRTEEIFFWQNEQLGLAHVVMFASVAAYAYGWVLSKRLIVDEGYPISLVTAVCMSISGLLALVTSFATECWNPVPIKGIASFAGVLILLVLVNIIVYVFNAYLLHFYSITFLMFLSFVDPLYVALYGWFFLGETVSWTFFVSVFGVFLGLYLFYREELQKIAQF